MNTHAYSAILLAMAAVLSSPVAAGAPDKPQADISGNWHFSTGNYARACQMSGQMQISKPETSGRHSCSFTTSEHCSDGRTASVRQSCVVSRSGDEVVITSSITDIVKMTPQRYGYAPDHWTLRIKSAQEMTGFLISAHNAPALFTRGPVPVS